MEHSIAPEGVIPTEATLLAIAVIVASGRLIPQLLHHRYLTISDCFLIASIWNAIALFTTDVITYRLGGMSDDSDPAEQSIADAIALKKVQFAGNYFYDTGIYLPKLAILSLYFRLFPPTMPWLRKALYTVSIFTVTAMLTTCLMDTFWCGYEVPVNWSLDRGACSTFNSKVVFRIDWVMNIVTDVLVSVLPFPMLYQLQLNRRQIWGLVATFSLGAVTIAVSVARFTTIEVIQAWTNVFVLSMAEMAVAIMVVSLPSMRAYIRRGGIFASRRAYGSSSSNNHHHRTPISRSEHMKLSSNDRSKTSARSRIEEQDSGSEVELNILARKDVIYETRRVSVQFSESTEADVTHSKKMF